MIFLTYFLSLLMFYVAYIIIYFVNTFIIGFLAQILSLTSFFQEWIKEILTIPVAFYMGLLVFKWMDKSYNILIIGALFTIFLFVGSLAEQSKKKYPQRLGYISGTLISIFYLS